MTSVKCPTCGKPTVYDPANPHRPFCSERCKIIDLGAWADEKYKVPAREDENSAVNENSEENDDKNHSAEKSPPKHLQN